MDTTNRKYVGCVTDVVRSAAHSHYRVLQLREGVIPTPHFIFLSLSLLSTHDTRRVGTHASQHAAGMHAGTVCATHLLGAGSRVLAGDSLHLFLCLCRLLAHGTPCLLSLQSKHTASKQPRTRTRTSTRSRSRSRASVHKERRPTTAAR